MSYDILPILAEQSTVNLSYFLPKDMHGRRRTTHQFNEVQEYFKNLDVTTKLKTFMPSTHHPRYSVTETNAEHPPSIQNIKVLAKKIKLVAEDGAQIKFSNFDGKVTQNYHIASTTQIALKYEIKQESVNSEPVTEENLTERVRVYVHEKIPAEDQWLKFLEKQDQQLQDQLDFELSQVNQNQNIDFFIKQNSQNIFDQKQTLWESQADPSDFWSFQLQNQSQNVSVVSDLVQAQTQDILQALQKSVQTSNEDNA